MMHRTQRAMLLVLLLLGATARAETGSGTAIGFHEIEAHYHATSPLARMGELRLDGARADGDAANQWSNPDLAYDHEHVGRLNEWQVTLAKDFARPLAQGAQRDGWAEHVRAAELRRDQDTRQQLAYLRAGYVRLRLLDRHLDRFASLADSLTHVSAMAAARHAEGEMSGLESRLLQLSALSIAADWRAARQRRHEHEAAWRADMGIPPDAGLELTTPVGYQPVSLEPVTAYLVRLDASPGVLADAAQVAALDHLADAARPRLVPGFSIYGGYKKIDDFDDGFVAGAALALPVFDRGGGTARKLEADRRIADHEAAIVRDRRAGEIDALVQSINTAGPALATLAAQFDDDGPAIDALLAAYRGGSLSLEGLLAAIQIEADALAGYHDQLVAHYENLFRLEALTGAAIVSLTP